MKTKNLKNIVKACTKVVGRNTVLPIMENILVKGNTLMVTDLNMYLSIKLPDDTLNGNYTLPFKDFKDMVATFEELSVTDARTDYRVDLIGDRAQISIQGDNFEDFPKPPTIEVERVGVLSQRDINNMQDALKYVSKDELRPVMMQVAITNKHIVSTDAHKLFFEPTHIEGEHKFLPKVVEVMAVFGGEWEVARNETYIAVTNGDVTIQFLECSDKYPDIFAVIPINNGIEMQVSTEELTNTIKQSLKFANTTSNQIVLSANGILEVSAEDIDFGKNYRKEVSKGYVKSGDDIRIGFNGKYLLEILNNSDTKITNFEMSSPGRGVIINGNVLLMPMNLND